METPCSVLIVDDEAHVRRALTRVLRQSSHEIDTAPSAAEALNCLAEKDYHLVISDLKMPDTDGIELLTLVSELYPQTSRMLLSGHADRNDLNNAINQCRVDQYLDKPWDNRELVATIDAITQENRRARASKAEVNQLDAELDAARKLQRSALPEVMDADDIDVRWMFESCSRLGGDGLNYWRRDNELHFFLLDVVGHGASAAMESFALQQMLNKRDLSDPASVVAELNDNYQFLSNPLRYFTILAGCLDITTGQLVFCQAGHPGPILVNRDDYTVEQYGDGGFPVGMLEGLGFENQWLIVGEDETLVLHSDGMAENGCEELRGMLLMNSDMQPAGLADKVVAWRADNSIDDDISALFISLHG